MGKTGRGDKGGVGVGTDEGRGVDEDTWVVQSEVHPYNNDGEHGDEGKIEPQCLSLYMCLHHIHHTPRAPLTPFLKPSSLLPVQHKDI